MTRPVKCSAVQTWRYLLLILIVVIVLMPLSSLVFSAIRGPAPANTSPFSLPTSISLQRFKDAWFQGRFNLFFKNSVIVTVAVVSVSVFLSTLSGYATGLLPMPGRRFLYGLMLIGFMIPFEAAIIPLYHLMGRLDLLDTYWALILPQIGLSVSFGTLWMNSFFENAPRELIDAAIIDGADRWKLLWQVLFPIAKPATTTLVVLFFMWTWNEFLLALVMVQNESMRTLPVGLAFFQGRYSANIPLLAAAALIVALPTVLIYILFQRFFIRGMLGGAIKG
jgi:raffinose/stachyose/melibiose transport system permease protein